MKLWQRLWELIPRPETKTQLFVVLALLLLLPLLAILQYRWLGQVSEGERAFLKANLNTAAERLSRDFNEELTRLFIALMLEPLPASDSAKDAASQDVVLNYYARFDKWRATAIHPQLVKALYLTHFESELAEHSDKLKLQCLDLANGQATECDWPVAVRETGSKYQEGLIEARKQMLRGEPMPPRRMPEGLLANVPAVIVPLRMRPPSPAPMVQRQRLIEAGNNVSRGPNIFFNMRQMGFLLVELDKELITKQILPNLVREHFANELNNYDLAFVTREASNEPLLKIGQSSPLPANADVAVPLFALQPFLMRNVLVDRIRQRSNNGQERVTVNTPPNPPGPMLMAMMDGANGVDNGQWQLLIRHRAGSLNAAVTKARRKNLLVGTSILILLAASLVLLLQSVRKAQRLAQAQMDFVAGVSHELRTPLSVIDAAGYNLTRGHIKDPEQIARYGGMIRQESRRLIDMVEQILEFAGAQAKQPHYDLQPTNLPELIEQTLATAPVTESGFVIEKQFASDLPPVQADANALQRALQNLLTNAIKYSGESRIVTLLAQRNPNNDAVHITVKDKGLGIAPSELPFIFEPFYRGKAVRDAQIHGNGLGLSLVKKIIEAHGGRVMVTSELGNGSAFTVSLPISNL